jgi:HEAT repeat protein
MRWDKKRDINEPTQKAIIVYDAGREDLLLQVRYEGSPEEFGWVVPVPGLPKVEKGSMRPFYELSRLTQGLSGVVTLSAGRRGSEDAGEAVKVIEVKTVGAYEVAILAARNAGSLTEWLQAHGYTLPEGKADIIEEYVRKQWFFVAVRIQLGQGDGFKLAGDSKGKAPMPAAAVNAIQKQLSSGELHPLRISFDTPHCIYPLRVSAIGGKPSEVSLYVLAAEPLMAQFIFEQKLAEADRRRQEWDRNAKERQALIIQCAQNGRKLMIAGLMYSTAPPPEMGQRYEQDWTVEALEDISNEDPPPIPVDPQEEDYYATPSELLECFEVKPDQIPQCTKEMPRLKGKNWYLTKQVWTFQPQDMRDLEFQPALPVLAATLDRPVGGSTAAVLARFRTISVPVLIAGCQSSNARERINASRNLPYLRDPRIADLLPALLNDKEAAVRYYAVRAIMPEWYPRFSGTLMGLLRDPHIRVRMEAAQLLSLHETKDRAPAYLALLQDPDPDVQARALQVLAKINPTAVPREDLVRLLDSPRLETVWNALRLLGRSQPWCIPARAPNDVPKDLTSKEAAPLTTNRFTLARLMGLKILMRNADAAAIELAQPLLRDTNTIVRNRAANFLRTVAKQERALDGEEREPE